MRTVAESILTLTSGDYPSQPFSPILPWCRLQLEGTEEKTLLSRLNKLGVRSPFREITASYLNGETPPEREDSLPMEKYYEREMFSHTLIRLFFSLIGEETGEVRIILEGDRSRLQDSFFNRLEKAPPPRGRELNLKVRRDGEIIHWDGLSSLTLPPGGLGEESDPEILNRALWFTLFGDNITACPYLGHLYEKARVGSLELNTEERAVLFREYGRVSLNLNLDDQALTSFNSLLNLGLVWRRKDFSAWAYRLTGEVYRKRGRPNEAALFFRKGLAQKTDQPGIRLSCLYGLFSLEEKSHPLSRSEKRELIALAEKERHFKYLALLLMEEENPSFPRIFALIDRTKNPLLKSKACLRRALYEEESGSPPEETAKWLRRALQNSRRGHYPPLESRIHLIMGKFYGKHNDPVKGFSCFRKSIEGNLKGEDFREIALAYGELGRMSLNLFETARAGYFLDTALQLLNVLPSREEDPIGEFDLLKELTLLAKGDREYGEVLTVFKRKKRRSSGEEELFLLLMESRLAEKREKREKLLARATDQARREGSFLLPWLEEAEGGEFSVPRQKWLKDPLDRDLIALSLKQFIRFNRLKKSMYEINLLWSVQTILAKAPDREMLILRTMERLLSSSLLSSISYYERLEESYRLAYHSSLIEEEPNRAVLDRFIARCGEGRTDLITEKEGWFCLPIYLESIPAGLIICQTESLTVPMKTEERQVYTILAGQFSAALERLRQKELILSENRQLEETNRELTITSLTDSLTGMGNRTGLDERLRDFSRRYRGDREKDNFALLFIDLDNFKYYNDSYGHVLGDKLLERFSRLLRDACRENDWFFRYGGDEFIILLAETDSVSATLIADRILYEMEEQEGFSDLLKSYGLDGEIPRSRWLGCSIGISDFRAADRDRETLLKQSDDALYRAKDSGKKQWIIYSKGEKT